MFTGDSLTQCQHEADHDSHYDEQKSGRHDARGAYCCNDPVDEHHDQGRPGCESDDGAENEIEESDMRGTSDDVDDGEWRDREDAHKDHRHESAAREAHGELVQTLAREPSQGVAAELATDGVAHERAQGG